MSPRLAARMAVLCTLVALATPAVAERRPVAVIDLTLGADRARDLATELRRELTTHAELQLLLSPAYENALIGVPPDDDAQRISSATTSALKAEEQLGLYNSPAAGASAESGMSGLPEVTPREAAKLYARLAFARGQALLGQHRPDEARSEFSLVHAITPNRVLDPNQTFPEVLDAFAKATPTGQGIVDVRGTGELWIDGTSYGAAPREVAIVAGRHVVQLTGVDRETRGVVVDVVERTAAAPDAKTRADVPDAAAADDLKIRRARLALAHAVDTVERGSTMGKLAKLIKVGDAILLSQRDGKLMVQTWRDQAPGFSKLEEFDARGTRKPADLLVPLAPPPPQKEPSPPVIIIPREEPRWYQSRKVKLGVAVGVLAAVVGAVLWARRGIEMQPPDHDVKSE